MQLQIQAYSQSPPLHLSAIDSDCRPFCAITLLEEWCITKQLNYHYDLSIYPLLLPLLPSLLYPVELGEVWLNL